jgi:hypothetical protein
MRLVPSPAGDGRVRLSDQEGEPHINLDVCEKNATITVVHRYPDSKTKAVARAIVAIWALFLLWQLIVDGYVTW